MIRTSTPAEFTALLDERYSRMAAIVALIGNKPAH